MKTIKIGICVRNNNYAHKLASVMTKQMSGLDISVISAADEALCGELSEYGEQGESDVILSDMDTEVYRPNCLLLEGESKISCCEEYRTNERIMSRFEPVSHILQRAVEIYEEINGIGALRQCENASTLYKFQSDMGGSGTTAVALTMARLLACEYGKKVLYINTGVYKSEIWYACDSQTALRPAAELECMIRNNMNFNIFSYTAKDPYGVYILEKSGRSGNADAVLGKICEEKNFDVIIADMAKNESKFLFSKTFVVSSEKDGRSRIARENYENAAEADGDVWEIRNRSSYNHIEKKVIYIADDAESFAVMKNGIEIALDKSFASGVRRLLSL